MKTLLKNHYLLIKKRGLIHPGTKMDDFMMKLEEQYLECCNAYADDVDVHRCPSDELVSELTELLLVVTDALQHYSMDLPEQIGKSNKRNEPSRLSFTV